MKLWKLLFFAIVLPVTFSCSSKKKATDADSAAVSGRTDNTNDSMSFDADGSDSKKIEGLYSVHFAFDKSVLDSEAKSNLQKNADWLHAHKTAKLKIEGHCDLKGSTEYNLALGEQRARSAKTYLTNLGIPEDRLETISFGKEKPLTREDNEEAQSKNRRDNFVPF